MATLQDLPLRALRKLLSIHRAHHNIRGYSTMKKAPLLTEMNRLFHFRQGALVRKINDTGYRSVRLAQRGRDRDMEAATGRILRRMAVKRAGRQLAAVAAPPLSAPKKKRPDIAQNIEVVRGSNVVPRSDVRVVTAEPAAASLASVIRPRAPAVARNVEIMQAIVRQLQEMKNRGEVLREKDEQLLSSYTQILKL